MVSPVIVNVLRQATDSSKQLLGTLAQIPKVLGNAALDKFFLTKGVRTELRSLDKEMDRLIATRKELRQVMASNLGNPAIVAQTVKQIDKVNQKLLQLQKTSKQIRKDNKLSPFEALRKGLNSTDKGFKTAFSNLQNLKVAIEGATAIVRAFGSAAIQANLEIQRGTKASAVVISGLTDVYDSAGNKVESFADKLAILEPRLLSIQKNLLKAAPDIIGVTSQDLLQTLEQVNLQFGSIQGQLKNSGIDDEFKAVEEVTKRLSQGLKAFGLQTRDIPQEVRALLTGDIDRNARFANQLGISGKDISNAKAQGKLVSFILDKTEALEGANQRYGNSLENTLSVLTEVQESFSRSFGEGLLDQAAKSLLKIRQTLEESSAEINALGKRLGDISAQGLISLFDNINGAIQLILENADSLDGTFTFVVSTITEFFTVISDAVVLVTLITVKVGEIIDTLIKGVPLIVSNFGGWVKQLLKIEDGTKNVNDNLKESGKIAANSDLFDFEEDTKSANGLFNFLKRSTRLLSPLALFDLSQGDTIADEIQKVTVNSLASIKSIREGIKKLQGEVNTGQGLTPEQKNQIKSANKFLLEEEENLQIQIKEIRQKGADQGLGVDSIKVKLELKKVQNAFQETAVEIAQLNFDAGLGSPEQRKNLGELLSQQKAITAELGKTKKGSKRYESALIKLRNINSEIIQQSKDLSESLLTVGEAATFVRKKIFEIKPTAEKVTEEFNAASSALKNAANVEELNKAVDELGKNLENAFIFDGSGVERQLKEFRKIATDEKSSLDNKKAALAQIEKAEARLVKLAQDKNKIENTFVSIAEKTGEITKDQADLERKILAIQDQRLTNFKTEKQIRDLIIVLENDINARNTQANTIKLQELETLRSQQGLQLELLKIEEAKLVATSRIADINKEVKEISEGIKLDSIGIKIETAFAVGSGELKESLGGVRDGLVDLGVQSDKLVLKRQNLIVIDSQIEASQMRITSSVAEENTKKAELLILERERKTLNMSIADSTLTFLNNIKETIPSVKTLKEEVININNSLLTVKDGFNELKLDRLKFDLDTEPIVAGLESAAKDSSGKFSAAFKETVGQLRKEFGSAFKGGDKTLKGQLKLIKKQTEAKVEGFKETSRLQKLEQQAGEDSRVQALETQKILASSAIERLNSVIQVLKVEREIAGLDPEKGETINSSQKIVESFKERISLIDKAIVKERQLGKENRKLINAKNDELSRQAKINGLKQQAVTLEKANTKAIKDSVSAKKAEEGASKKAAAAKKAEANEEKKKNFKKLGQTKSGGSFASDTLRNSKDESAGTVAKRRQGFRAANSSSDPRIITAIENLQKQAKKDRKEAFNDIFGGSNGIGSGSTTLSSIKKTGEFINKQGDIFKKTNQNIATLSEKFAKIDKDNAANQQKALDRLAKSQELVAQKQEERRAATEKHEDKLISLIGSSAKKDKNLVKIIGNKAFGQRAKWIELQQELLQEARDARAAREEELQLGKNQVDGVISLQDVIRSGGIIGNIESAQGESVDQELLSGIQGSLNDAFGADSDLITAIVDGSFKPEDFESDSKLFLDPKTGELIVTGKNPDLEGLNQLVELQLSNTIAERQTGLLENIAENTGTSLDLSNFSDFFDEETGIVRNAFGEVIDIVDLTKAANADSLKELSSFLTKTQMDNQQFLNSVLTGTGETTDTRVTDFQNRNPDGIGQDLERIIGANTNTLEEVQAQQESFNQNQQIVDELTNARKEFKDLIDRGLGGRQDEINNIRDAESRKGFTLSSDEFNRLTDGLRFKDKDRKDRKLLERGERVSLSGDGRKFSIGDRSISLEDNGTESNIFLSRLFEAVESGEINGGSLDEQQDLLRVKELELEIGRLEQLANRDEEILNALSGNPELEAEQEELRLRTTVETLVNPLIQQIAEQEVLFKDISDKLAANIDNVNDINVEGRTSNILREIGEASGLGTDLTRTVTPLGSTIINSSLGSDLNTNRFLSRSSNIPHTSLPSRTSGGGGMVTINNFPSDLGRLQTITRLSGG